MIGKLVSLFYPDVCSACNGHLVRGEEKICTACMYHLPKTDYHLIPDNPMIRHLWGKQKIEAAAAYFFFNKGEKVQRLVHNLKYKKQTELGVFIGKLYGTHLKETSPFRDAGLIIPVPLHPAKLLKRGFNQSELFARGLGIAMNKVCDTELLVRRKFSETQTRKSRYHRWSNVKDIFALETEKERSAVRGTHFLLVDDVVTTGSTLEACAEALLKIPGSKVSIAAIAYSAY